MLAKFLAVWGQSREGGMLMAGISWPLWGFAGLPQKFLFWVSVSVSHCLHSFPQEGKKWEEGPCKLCECREAQVTCYEPSCPPCPVATLAMAVKGQCCPDCTPGRSMSLLRWFSCQENSEILSFFFQLFFVAHFWRFFFFFLFFDKLFLLFIFAEFVWLQPHSFGQVIRPLYLVFLIIKYSLFILQKNLYLVKYHNIKDSSWPVGLLLLEI